MAETYVVTSDNRLQVTSTNEVVYTIGIVELVQQAQDIQAKLDEFNALLAAIKAKAALLGVTL